MIDVSLFGGLITINQLDSTLTTNLDRYIIQRKDLTELERHWNLRIKELIQNVNKTYFCCSIDVVKRGIENSFAIKDKSIYTEHPDIGFFYFEFEARSGEFELENHIHGLLEANGKVNVTINGTEELVYDSLRDFYDHYYQDAMVTYHYACQIGTWSDGDKLSIDSKFTDEQIKYIREYAKPARDDHCTDKLWSDRLHVMTPSTFKQRHTPIMLKGVLIDAGF